MARLKHQQQQKRVKYFLDLLQTFESDPEPFGHIRDHNVEAMCRELGITVVKENSHTLYDLDK